MIYLLTTYFVIGLFFALYAVGYHERDVSAGRMDKKSLAATSLFYFVAWPAILAIGFGVKTRESAENDRKMKREHDEMKERVEAELKKGKK